MQIKLTIAVLDPEYHRFVDFLNDFVLSKYNGVTVWVNLGRLSLSHVGLAIDFTKINHNYLVKTREDVIDYIYDPIWGHQTILKFEQQDLDYLLKQGEDNAISLSD